MNLRIERPERRKIRSLQDGVWQDHVHARTYRIESASSGSPRICAGIPAGDPDVISRLVDSLEEPVFLLYVLHTPRGEGDPGRYQSPELHRAQVLWFLHEFSGFLTGDARFDLWVHAPSMGATLVWDRHDLLYAYGDLEAYLACLQKMGFMEGDVVVPSPHEHHYQMEFDAQAAEVLRSFEWTRTPLKPEDEQ